MNIVTTLLSGEHSLFVGPCDGSKTIVTQKNLFKEGIDSSFRRLGDDKPSQATDHTPISVYEIIKDVTSLDLFYSFLHSRNDDLNKIALTQHQIIKFCNKYRSSWLRRGSGGTLFLFKGTERFVIAGVDVHPKGLYIYRDRLGCPELWREKHSHRVVIKNPIE